MPRPRSLPPCFARLVLVGVSALLLCVRTTDAAERLRHVNDLHQDSAKSRAETEAFILREIAKEGKGRRLEDVAKTYKIMGDFVSFADVKAGNGNAYAPFGPIHETCFGGMGFYKTASGGPGQAATMNDGCQVCWWVSRNAVNKELPFQESIDASTAGGRDPSVPGGDYCRTQCEARGSCITFAYLPNNCNPVVNSWKWGGTPPGEKCFPEGDANLEPGRCHFFNSLVDDGSSDSQHVVCQEANYPKGDGKLPGFQHPTAPGSVLRNARNSWLSDPAMNPIIGAPWCVECCDSTRDTYDFKSTLVFQCAAKPEAGTTKSTIGINGLNIELNPIDGVFRFASRSTLVDTTVAPWIKPLVPPGVERVGGYGAAFAQDDQERRLYTCNLPRFGGGLCTGVKPGGGKKRCLSDADCKNLAGDGVDETCQGFQQLQGYNLTILVKEHYANGKYWRGVCDCRANAIERSTTDTASAVLPNGAPQHFIEMVTIMSSDHDFSGNECHPSAAAGGACFPGDATVLLRGGERRRMDELEIGDAVLVADGTYSSVYAFSHREVHAASVSLFVEISVATSTAAATATATTTTMTTTRKLLVSDGHYVRVGGVLVAARDVKVGDAMDVVSDDDASSDHLVRGIVSAIRTVARSSAFAPQTVHGDIVVDGVLASTYTEAVCTPATCGTMHFLLSPWRVAHKLLAWAGRPKVPVQFWPSASGGVSQIKRHRAYQAFISVFGGKAAAAE